MIVRDRSLIDNGIGAVFLLGCIAEHERDVARMDELARAYASQPGITQRRVTEGMPNNKLIHNYGRYIVAVSSGYLVGNPVSYQSDADIVPLLDAYEKARVDSVDAELAKDAALFGKGVELCFADTQAQPQTAALDPRSAFVVYDNDVKNTPILGIRQYARMAEDGTADGVVLIVYTEDAVLTYTGTTAEQAARTVPQIEPHYFGAVPMVEYWNNDDETGDFEHVMSLINAYDLLQSDRVNDKEQLVQAILVMTGARMEAEPDILDEQGNVTRKGRTAAQQIRQDKMLFLPDQDATAHYLTKNLAEGDVEILKDSIKSDIHKFSMVPDLSDVNFAGNASGVAMRYKLFGMEQLTKVKERWFREALIERMRLFTNFLKLKGQRAIDPDEVEIVFKRALPANEMELAQMVSTLKGIVPQETLLAQLPFISDPAEAATAIQEESAQAFERQQAAFGTPMAERDEA